MHRAVGVLAQLRFTEPTVADAASKPCFPLFSLPPDLLRKVVSSVPRNEVAGSLKPTCRAAAELLADFPTISCSEPVPAHALVWKWSQAEAVKGIPRLQRETVAKRAMETGCLHTVQRLVTGEGGPEEMLQRTSDGRWMKALGATSDDLSSQWQATN